MKVSIRHNGYYIAEFDRIEVNGRPAIGGFAFGFILKGNRKSCETPLVIINISLELKTSDTTTLITPHINSTTQHIEGFKFPNNSEQLHFDLFLTKDQANALENYRGDGDLKLNVGLRALTSIGGQILSSYDCADFCIHRELWLKALSASGFRQTILLEVPVPKVNSETSQLILKAQQFIEHGHYKDSVMQCRRIIEHVELARGDKNDAMNANKKLQKGERESMTVIERMFCMREQLKNICQLGAHGTEDFTRSQAKAVLSVTLSLLAEPTVGFVEVEMCGGRE